MSYGLPKEMYVPYDIRGSNTNGGKPINKEKKGSQTTVLPSGDEECSEDNEVKAT